MSSSRRCACWPPCTFTITCTFTIPYVHSIFCAKSFPFLYTNHTNIIWLGFCGPLITNVDIKMWIFSLMIILWYLKCLFLLLPAVTEFCVLCKNHCISLMWIVLSHYWFLSNKYWTWWWFRVSSQLCVQNSPQEARNMLLQNPQLAYALLQAQVVMRIVDPEIALVSATGSFMEILR